MPALSNHGLAIAQICRARVAKQFASRKRSYREKRCVQEACRQVMHCLFLLQLACVQLLVEYGASIEEQDEDAATPYEIAMHMGFNHTSK